MAIRRQIGDDKLRADTRLAGPHLLALDFSLANWTGLRHSK